MKQISRSPNETRKIGVDFAKGLAASLKDRPVLVGLFGDLGAGKTTFVQGMARGCGIDPDYYVNSPTFTLINEYRGRDVTVIHVDLYRMEKASAESAAGGEEGTTLALEEYLRPGNLIVIEWPSRWPDLVNDLDFQIRFETVSDTVRTIETLPCTT